jgi:hypothetical protein
MPVISTVAPAACTKCNWCGWRLSKNYNTNKHHIITNYNNVFKCVNSMPNITTTLTSDNLPGAL